MTFDRDYWEQHWRQPHRTETPGDLIPHPYLAREAGGLAPGTALDAGCGTGTEAIWLATRGWQVTAADIAPEVLDRAAARVPDGDVAGRLRWVEADLTRWHPERQFDLVTTHYAHPATTQTAFYERIAGWVAPGGNLLIVGHLHPAEAAGHGHHPHAGTTVTLADITALLDGSAWEITTAEQHVRAVTAPGGSEVVLHDVVVRAARRS